MEGRWSDAKTLKRSVAIPWLVSLRREREGEENPDFKSYT
jgi:hypothetical protein